LTCQPLQPLSAFASWFNSIGLGQYTMSLKFRLWSQILMKIYYIIIKHSTYNLHSIYFDDIFATFLENILYNYLDLQYICIVWQKLWRYLWCKNTIWPFDPFLISFCQYSIVIRYLERFVVLYSYHQTYRKRVHRYKDKRQE